MRATTYHPVEPYARGYVVHPWHGTLREEPRTDTGAMAPAGQLWSTLADLVTWGQLLGGTRPDVLATSSLEEMQRPVTADYGLGLMLGIKMKTDSRQFVNWLRGQGLLAVAAGDNVMRVLPPLIIDESHIKEFVEGLSAAAARYEVPAAAA